MALFMADSISVAIDGRRILRGVYLKVDEGERVGLVGLNGSGKTTLFRCISGELRHGTGVVHVRGDYVPPGRRWRHVAYLRQNEFLPRHRTLRSVASLFAGGDGIRTVSADGRLKPLLGRRFDTLSGGERRYAEFLLVLSLDREITLLDEPFARVEPLFVERMQGVLRERSEKSFLITDHNHVDVREVCHRLVLMDDGRASVVGSSGADLARAKYLPKQPRPT